MSSMGPSLTEQLAEAREKLDRACDLLLAPTPGALDQCAPLLEAAVTKVAACQAAIGGAVPGEPEAAEEGRRLRTAVRRARRLLESAAEYHQNWTRRMGAMSAGYDGRGEPVAVTRGRSLNLRG